MPGLTLLLQDDSDPCRRTYTRDLTATYGGAPGFTYPSGVAGYSAGTAAGYGGLVTASYGASPTVGYGGASGASYPAGAASYPAGTASYTSGTATYGPNGEPSYGGCDGTE